MILFIWRYLWKCIQGIWKPAKKTNRAWSLDGAALLVRVDAQMMISRQLAFVIPFIQQPGGHVSQQSVLPWHGRWAIRRCGGGGVLTTKNRQRGNSVIWNRTLTSDIYLPGDFYGSGSWAPGLGTWQPCHCAVCVALLFFWYCCCCCFPGRGTEPTMISDFLWNFIFKGRTKRYGDKFILYQAWQIRLKL